MHSLIHQGQFGEAFVRLLAVAAGLTVSKPEPDVTGQDFIFGYAPESVSDPLFGATINVQVKSWQQSIAVRRDGHWQYRMDRKQFNRLAALPPSVPTYLVLVIVPDDWRKYTIASMDDLSVRHCAYWVPVPSSKPVDPAPTGKVLVPVPMANMLDAPGLLGLFGAGDSGKVSA